MTGLGFTDIPHDECLELLGSKTIGRVAFCWRDVPEVLPVNYVLRDGAVVFRTISYGLLAEVIQRRPQQRRGFAFQVDEADEYLKYGWSVLAVGMPEIVTDIDELKALRSDGPEPWPAGSRNLVVSIEPSRVTGRRVVS